MENNFEAQIFKATFDDIKQELKNLNDFNLDDFLNSEEKISCSEKFLNYNNMLSSTITSESTITEVSSKTILDIISAYLNDNAISIIFLSVILIFSYLFLRNFCINLILHDSDFYQKRIRIWVSCLFIFSIVAFITSFFFFDFLINLNIFLFFFTLGCILTKDESTKFFKLQNPVKEKKKQSTRK